MAYQEPVKKIVNQFDLNPWYHSQAYKDYMDFLRKCNDAVVGTATTAEIEVSPFCIDFIGYMEHLQKFSLDFPPEDQADQRFGNKAFRGWLKHVQEQGRPLMEANFPPEKRDAIAEVFPYFAEAFGNSTRIDYGSGHEMSFIIFLLCLYKLDIFTEKDLPAVVLRVFNKYLRVCRYLQVYYNMEPAGSRGVHAIDDFQFVPFIWGSAQMISRGQKILPDHYPRKDVCTGFGHVSLFLEAVEFIHKHKSGPFHEHSNQLWNISAVPTWEKVNSGMFKMYEAEVMKKFPVVQHTLFGSLFNWERRPDAPNEPLHRVAATEPTRQEQEEELQAKLAAAAAMKPTLP